jgi:hypothetical protein
MERVLHARECRAMGVRAVLQLAVVVGWAGLYCLSSRSLYTPGCAKPNRADETRLRAARGASCDLRVLVVVMSSSNNDVQWQRYVAVLGGALSRCCGCVQQHGALAETRVVVLCISQTAPRHSLANWLRLRRRLP